jgi:hypothetical protein
MAWIKKTTVELLKKCDFYVVFFVDKFTQIRCTADYKYVYDNSLSQNFELNIRLKKQNVPLFLGFFLYFLM